MCNVHFQVLTARNLSLLPCFWSSFLSLFSGTKPNQFRQFYVRFKSTLSPGRSQLTRFTSHIVSLSLPPPLSSFPLSSTPPSSLPLSSPSPSPPPPSFPFSLLPLSFLGCSTVFITWITQLKFTISLFFFTTLSWQQMRQCLQYTQYITTNSRFTIHNI